MKQSMAFRGQLGLLAFFVLASAWSSPLVSAKPANVDEQANEAVSRLSTHVRALEDVTDEDKVETVDAGKAHALGKRDIEYDMGERKSNEQLDENANVDAVDASFDQQKPPMQASKQQLPVRANERSMNLGDGADLAEGNSKLRMAGLGFVGYFCFAMIVLGIVVMLDKAGFSIRRGGRDGEESSSYRSRSTY